VWGNVFFARKFDNNDDDDDGMMTMTRIQWCWQWGLLLMESKGGSYTQQSNDEGVYGAPIMRCFVVLEFNNNDGNLGGESLLDIHCHPQNRITPSVASCCRLLIVALALPQPLIITYAN